VIPFFVFPAEVRKIIYTTNAIESLNASVRKAVRNKGHFLSEQAATKLIWLALRHITENWRRPPIAWQAAKAQLAIQFGERFAFNDRSMQPALTQDFRQAPPTSWAPRPRSNVPTASARSNACSQSATR
jgi:hypothetical protein